MIFSHSIQRRGILIGSLFLFSSLLSCLESFVPDSNLFERGVLVVDGYINVGNQVTTIALSRTTLISSPEPDWERGAKMTIVSDEGSSFPLHETSPGIYRSEASLMPVNLAYKLVIELTDGDVYETQFSSVMQSPPIDSLTFSVSDFLNIHAHSHDETGEIKYYRWYFQEDWEIHAKYWSEFMIANDTIVSRPLNERPAMYYCWQSSKSRGFIIGNTVEFQRSNINHVVQRVPLASEKVRVKYAITVQQHPLSMEEYKLSDLDRQEYGPSWWIFRSITV